MTVDAADTGMVQNVLAKLGGGVNNFLTYVGGVTVMTFETVVSYFKPPFDFQALFTQIYIIGVQSLPVAMIAAAFIGMVLALQLTSGIGLARFGAKTLVGGVVAIGLVRELGPVVTSLLVGGRVGAGMTAEIGSMQLAEQIDAMRSLGASPLQKLVGPRMLASIIVFPLLTVLADIIGILGGMVITNLEANMEIGLFLNNAWKAIAINDIMSGIAKTFFFGYFVSAVACYNGLRTSGGTEGLGLATTFTVMLSLILILISNFFLTKAYIVFFE